MVHNMAVAEKDGMLKICKGESDEKWLSHVVARTLLFELSECWEAAFPSQNALLRFLTALVALFHFLK